MGTNGNQKATGKRARTRELYAKAFKTKGLPALARYLTTYKRGDLVDIKADPSIQVGMPSPRGREGRAGMGGGSVRGAVGTILAEGGARTARWRGEAPRFI